MDRADHHARSVDQVILPLTGAIVAYHEPNSIEVLSMDGDMKNALWARINGTRYTFPYDHESGGRITVKRGGRRGEVVARSTTAPP